jgi:subtilase family serine protease
VGSNPTLSAVKKVTLLFFILFVSLPFLPAQAAYRFADFKAHPPIHILGNAKSLPAGFSPEQIKSVYNLPKTGGKGTIAIIGAYDDPTIEKDLQVFNKQFNLADCTSSNGCFEKHTMSNLIKPNSGWAMEASLDVEWSHAIAPNANILLVEATTPSGKNLLQAIDYATSRKDVVAISMSWGGAEFPEETTLDSHFISKYGASFFASSGDNGAGASWPAASPNVVGVGGTSLNFLKNNTMVVKETAWSESGGGVSVYEKQPNYQADYSISKAKGYRAIPDVAYNADPQSGFAIYKSPTGRSKNGWYVVGGTSAGAPQWAAIQALGHSATNQNFYTDKSSPNNTQYFHDIISGSNGDCGYYCTARKHYDYVTGLGSPFTTHF